MTVPATAASMALRLVRKPREVPQEQRGRLLQSQEIAEVIFNSKVSKKWVLEKVPHEYRHKVGRMILYYEGEVRYWAETLREAA